MDRLQDIRFVNVQMGHQAQLAVKGGCEDTAASKVAHELRNRILRIAGQCHEDDVGVRRRDTQSGQPAQSLK